MAYKPILVEVIDRLYVGDEEAVPQAEKRGMSILAACKDGSIDCHRAVLGYTTLERQKIVTIIPCKKIRSTWL